MYYRLKLKSLKKEHLAVNDDKTVGDILQRARDIYKFRKSKLIIVDERTLEKVNHKTIIESGRTYIVKRVPWR